MKINETEEKLLTDEEAIAYIKEEFGKRGEYYSDEEIWDMLMEAESNGKIAPVTLN